MDPKILTINKISTIYTAIRSLLAVGAVLFCLTGYGQTAEKTIERYVKFIGGAKKWAGIQSITSSGEYDYGGIKFPFTAFSRAPDRYKYAVKSNGKYFAQAYDGTKGWKIDGFKNEKAVTFLSGEAAKAMANENDVELEYALINYQSKGHSAVQEQDTTIAGKACAKIRFRRKSGEIQFYYFDKQRGALVYKKAVSKNLELGGTWLWTAYTEYKEVEGVKLPFKTTSESNGQLILTITISKVKLDLPLSDDDFLPPHID
jgi:hypothetical protein